MPDPETTSSFGDNSELAFYRNVTEAANDERHLKTFLDNEASKASPAISSNFTDRLSPQFSPLSAATTPLRTGSAMLPLPPLSLEPSAYDAVSTQTSTTNWKSYGKEMPLAWVKARDIKVS